MNSATCKDTSKLDFDFNKNKKNLLNISLKKNLLILFVVVALSKDPPSFVSSILHHVVICSSPTSKILESRSCRPANNNVMQIVADKGGGTFRKCYNNEKD